MNDPNKTPTDLILQAIPLLTQKDFRLDNVYTGPLGREVRELKSRVNLIEDRLSVAREPEATYEATYEKTPGREKP